jgi:sortase A
MRITGCARILAAAAAMILLWPAASGPKGAVRATGSGCSLTLVFETDAGPVSGALFSLFAAGPGEEGIVEAVGMKALASAVTDASGEARFEGLAEGAYLVRGESVCLDGTVFEPEAFTVRLPYKLESGGARKDVRAEIKYKIRTPEPPGGPESPGEPELHEPPGEPEPPGPSGESEPPEVPEELPPDEDAPPVEPDSPPEIGPQPPAAEEPPVTVPGDNPQTGVFSRAPYLLISAGLLLLTAGLISGIAAERGELAAQRAAAEDLRAYRAAVSERLDAARDAAELRAESFAEAVPYTSDLSAAEPDLQDVNGMIGVLSFPDRRKSFAVRGEWSDELLLRGPCRISGSAAARDLVIAGHNYRSHLRFLWEAGEGERAEFTGADGRVLSYAAAAVERIAGSDVQAMSSGDWDLTVFTCTADARDRIAVRFRLTEEL